ncbi:MAG: mechanosensitive ion channel, partial [Bdellovibrionales bacterium]
GLEVLVPNKQMYTSTLINYTLTKDMRLDFTMGISYAEDLEKVERVTRNALVDIRGRNEEKNIEFYFKEFGDSSINFVLHVWIIYPGDNYYWKAHHDIVTKIKKAFDENDITIPFPIRTIDFGIKGGKTLKSMISIGPNDSIR